MRWILWIITLLMVLLGAIVIVGGQLPRVHEVTRTVELAAPPRAVFALISDLEGMPAWRPEVYRVERAIGKDGQPAYREHGVRSVVLYDVLEEQPPRRLVLRIAGAGPGFEGTWTFDVAPAPAGARLTIIERGEIENPVFRFLSRFVVGHGKAVDAYLEALAARLGLATLHIE
jgi:uncharacterized protein YndB with AHSA1/START domain